MCSSDLACQLLGGVAFDSQSFINTSTQIVTKENMFSLEGQKALFPFDAS